MTLSTNYLINNLKLTQLNVGKGRSTTVDILNYCFSKNCDILIVQEPYTYNNKLCYIPRSCKIVACESSVIRPKAAIISLNKNLDIIIDSHFTTTNMATAVLTTSNSQCFVLVSLYLNIVDDINVELELLKLLLIKYTNSKILIFTDSNCRSSRWGDRLENQRGSIFKEFIDSNDLFLFNDVNQGPTFIKSVTNRDNERTVRTSFIDLTLSNDCYLLNNATWTIDSSVNLTEHQIINLELVLSTNLTTLVPNRIYDCNKIDRDKLLETFRELKPHLIYECNHLSEIETIISDLCNSVNKAIKSSTKLLKTQPHLIGWYNSDLKKMKKEIDRLRRTIQRGRNLTNVNELYDQLKNKNLNYKKEIIKAKKKFYIKKNTPTSTQDLWKKYSQILGSRRSFQSGIVLDDGVLVTDRQKIDTSFLKFLSGSSPIKFNLDIVDDQTTSAVHYNNYLKINGETLSNLIKQIPNGKTPGYDYIPNEIIKILVGRNLVYFVDLFNLLSKYSYFPKIWKISKLILINKPNKPSNKLDSYRPISLLVSFSKLYEIVIKYFYDLRIQQIHLSSFNQHGFNKGKSTLTALRQMVDKAKQIKKSKQISYLLMVDIAGAFDHICHHHIINNATEYDLGFEIVDLIKSMLSDRSIVLNGWASDLTKGCPQGGVLSPSLWNLGMVDLLENLDSLSNVQAVAYADDLAILIYGTNELIVKYKTNHVLAMMRQWCTKSGLNIKSEKSSLLHLSGKAVDIDVNFNGVKVQEVSYSKYLGVILDNKLNYNQHLAYLITKSNSIIGALNLVLGKPSTLSIEHKIHIYKSVVLPGLTYGCEIWYRNIQSFKNKLRKIQRPYLLMISGAYRTTSSFKLYKLLNILPLDLQIELMIEKQDLRNSNRWNSDSRRTLENAFSTKRDQLCAGVEFTIRIDLDEGDLIGGLTPNIVQALTGHAHLLFIYLLKRFCNQIYVFSVIMNQRQLYILSETVFMVLLKMTLYLSQLI